MPMIPPPDGYEDISSQLGLEEEEEENTEVSSPSPQITQIEPTSAEVSSQEVKGYWEKNTRERTDAQEWVENEVNVPFRDWIDDTFQGDQKLEEEIAAERERIRGLYANDPFINNLNEAASGITGGVEDFGIGVYNKTGETLQGIEKVANWGEQIGPEFVPIKTRLIPENSTGWGKGLRTLSRYMTGAFLFNAATGGALTQGQVGLKLQAGRFAEGAIPDFVAASPEDQTLAGSLINETVGRTPITRWLMADPENPQVYNDLLTAIEGGLFSNAFGFVGDFAPGFLSKTKKTISNIFAGKKVDPKDVEEALKVTNKLNEVSDVFEYGGDPNEKVLTGSNWTTYKKELKVTQSILETDTTVEGQLVDTINNLTGQISQSVQEGGGFAQELAEGQARAAATPTMDDLVKGQVLNINLTGAQVDMLNAAGLPEGVTITGGRRVRGLNTSNADELIESLRNTNVEGKARAKVQAHLLNRLEGIERPAPIPSDAVTRESITEGLEATIGARESTYQRAVQLRVEKTKLQEQLAKKQLQIQQAKVEIEAYYAKLSGHTGQFRADYVPVKMDRSNVSSIVKENYAPGFGGQPGLDLYIEDGRAFTPYNGQVKHIDFEPGYGWHCTVECIDPKTGDSFDMVIAHLEEGSMKVEVGDLVAPGQEIATQGGTGNVRSADGTITSYDFFEVRPAGTKDMTPYKRYGGLVNELELAINKEGGIVPTPTAKAASELVQPELVEQAIKQADEVIETTTRKAATEEGHEVASLVNVKPKPSNSQFPEVDYAPKPRDPDSLQVSHAELSDADIAMIGIAKDKDNPVKKIYKKLERQAKWDFANATEIYHSKEAQEWAEEFLGVKLEDLEDLASRIDISKSASNGSEWQFSARGFRANTIALQQLTDEVHKFAQMADYQIRDGSPLAGQSREAVIDRLEALSILRMEHKQTVSGALRLHGDFKDIANVTSNAISLDEYKTIVENLAEDKAWTQQLRQSIDRLKEGLKVGHPATTKRLGDVIRILAINEDIGPMAPLKMLQSITSAYLKDFDGAFIIGLLSSPKTHAVNTTAGLVRTYGNSWLMQLGGFMPGPGGKNEIISGAAEIAAMNETLAEVRNLFPKIWRQSKALSNSSKVSSIWDETLEKNMEMVRQIADKSDNQVFRSTVYGAFLLKNVLSSRPFSYVTDLLQSEDQLIKVFSGRQIATRKAYEDAFTIFGSRPNTPKAQQEFAEMVVREKEKYLKEIFDEDGITFLETPLGMEAAKHGRMMTFQVSTAEMDQFTKVVHTASQFPGMKIGGLTFIKTPSEILKAAAGVVPVAGELNWVVPMMQGRWSKLTAAEKAQVNGTAWLSRLLLTPVLMLGAMGHDSQIRVTGAGPLNYREFQKWQAAGNDRFRAYIGPVVIDYSRMDPLTTPVGLIADIGSLYMGDMSAKSSNAIDASIWGLSFANFFNKSWTEQLAQITDTISDWENAAGRTRYLNNIGRGLMPMGSLLRTGSGMMDPFIRETRQNIEPDWRRRILNNELGYQADYPVRVDPVNGKELTDVNIEGLPGFIINAMNRAGAFGGLAFSKNRFRPIHKKLWNADYHIANRTKALEGTTFNNEEMVEFIRQRASGGDMEKELLEFFNSSGFAAHEKLYDGEIKAGKLPQETILHKTLDMIVNKYSDKAKAYMRYGESTGARSWQRRHQKSMEEKNKPKSDAIKEINLLY